MPSQKHQVPLRIIQNQPALAPFLLKKVLGYELPAHTETTFTSSHLGNCTPKEWTSDEAVVLRDGTQAVLAIAVERQDGRDKDKRLSWPAYLSVLHGRLECPAVLIVLCPDRALASWCAQPMRSTVRSTMTMYWPVSTRPPGRSWRA
ncbi:MULTISPECIES: hypothetical protein [Nocardiopsis]|uniref:Uncharacterized protein n=1 Tax=Nocardiopsis sinuspersici TaxID=501010 RepID=A0A1V3C5L0_9ACTN|nr:MULTISPECIES: hypothetical protein [Nocardiopsis]OOC55983.1 hypothetical protein NOSIN_20860 [Nocardiopsis sinuspersici]